MSASAELLVLPSVIAHRAKLFFQQIFRPFVHGAPKSFPLKNLANFSRTTERCDITFYTPVTHSIIRKFRKFHNIFCKIYKITPAFDHGNLAVETLSEIVSTIQDSANAVSVNTF